MSKGRRCGMIIRSQDKKSIINFDRVDTVRLSRCAERGVIKEHYQTDIFYYTEDTFGVLGTYSTEEKAIKVLDMIQQEYGKHLYGQGGQMATADIYIQPFAFIPPKVFQMPSDEEVEV